MAERVAEAWGLDKRYIVPADSASVKRNVASPPDISMDISRLRQVKAPPSPHPLPQQKGHQLVGTMLS
jgi:hypothetical protein